FGDSLWLACLYSQVAQQRPALVKPAGPDHLLQPVLTLKQLDLRVQLLFRHVYADHPRILVRTHDGIHSLMLDQELGCSPIFGWCNHRGQHCAEQNGAKSYEDGTLMTESNSDQIPPRERI